MKEEQDYIRDLAEIRSMMERSSKFLSLSGWAGILAGIYALAGALISYRLFNFNPGEAVEEAGADNSAAILPKIIGLAVIVLAMAIGTAIILSYKNAEKRGEKIWNSTTRRLLNNMGLPLVAGGILILIALAKGFTGLIAPLSLIFYGLALCNASIFTYKEVKILGLIEIMLGLISAYFTGFQLICWAFGFGVLHIIYGIYIHYRYEK